MHVDRLLPKLDLDDASAQPLPFHPATALSLPRSSPFCHPERSRADLRCAIRVPRPFRFHNLHLSSTEPSWKHLSPLCDSEFPRVGRRTADPLGCAPPDFLLRLVALANFMRLSLRERRTRNRVQRSVAGNPGRDDKERAAVHKGQLLNPGIFQTNLDRSA